MTTKASDCLFLLGMHRSGNSLLSGCLRQLGFNLGNTGPTGESAFENQDIVLAHEILFRDLGCRWDMVGSLPEGWEESEVAEQTTRKLARIVEKQFRGHGPWIIKDPRLCRVMPIWHRVLAELELTPNFVHILRHPYEVASSLNQQYPEIDLFKGHLLWLIYNRDAIRASHGYPSIMLTYDQLVADPIASLLRISGAFNLHFPNNPVHCVHQISEYIRPELKRHYTPNNGDKKAYSQYAWVYEQFRLNQFKSIGNDTNATAIAAPLADLPMLAPMPSPAPETNGHAAEMFNHLLGMIGGFERSDFNEQRLRQRRLLNAGNMSETLYAETYFPQNNEKSGTYSEKNSKKVLLAPNEWQEVSWEISRPLNLRTHRLRIDPLNTRGTVSLTSIKIVNTATDRVLWLADDRTHFGSCTVTGDGIALPEAHGLKIICTGNHAQLLLPKIPDLPDCPMQLKLWINVSRNQTILHEIWPQLRAQQEKLENDLKSAQTTFAEKEAVFAEIEASYASKEKEGSKHRSFLNNKLQDAENIVAELKKEIHITAQEHASREKEIAALKSQLNDRLSTIKALEKDLTHQKELSKQYYSALIQADQESQELKNQTTALSHDLHRTNHDKQETLTRLQNLRIELDRNKAVIHRLNHDTDSLTKLSHSMKQSNEQRKAETIHVINLYWQLSTWIKMIKHDLTALKQSRRYRFGTAIGRVFEILRLQSRKITAMDGLEAIITEFDKFHGRNSDSINALAGITPTEGEKLVDLLKQLDSDYKAFSGSRRWRIGNALLRIIEVLLFRSKSLLAMEQMKNILSEFNQWLNQIYDRPLSTHTPDETKQLHSWIQILEHNFNATLASRRWRWGSRMAHLIKAITLRGQGPLVTAHMQQLFDDYKNFA